MGRSKVFFSAAAVRRRPGSMYKYAQIHVVCCLTCVSPILLGGFSLWAGAVLVAWLTSILKSSSHSLWFSAATWYKWCLFFFFLCSMQLGSPYTVPAS